MLPLVVLTVPAPNVPKDMVLMLMESVFTKGQPQAQPMAAQLFQELRLLQIILNVLHLVDLTAFVVNVHKELPSMSTEFANEKLIFTLLYLLPNNF